MSNQDNQVVGVEVNNIINMMEQDYTPAFFDEAMLPETSTKFPLTTISALGTNFIPVVNTIKESIGPTEKLFKLVISSDSELVSKNSSITRDIITKKINGTKNLVEVNPNKVLSSVNPTMVMMSIALAGIDQKLITIIELQEEILSFLSLQQRSELKGDLNFLTDIMENYKFNWDNEKYKNSHHIKVLDIRQDAQRKINFYSEQINTQANKKVLIKNEQDINKRLVKIQNEFKDYQLALYIYSFSSYVEVMLLENFDKSYLSSVVTSIEKYSKSYRDLYTICYETFDTQAKSSIESIALGKVSSFIKVAGKGVAKVPLVNKSQLDETMIDSGNKLAQYNIKRNDNKLEIFINNHQAHVRPFIENINSLNSLFNNESNIYFDKDNIYLSNQ